MHRLPDPALALLLLLLLPMMTMTSSSSTPVQLPSHNITTILDTDPRFSSFNNHLTTTGLADLINNVTDITVCALDNEAMADLLSLKPTQSSLKKMLLFHIFTGYSDLDFLTTSCCAWTMFPRPSGTGYEVVDLQDFGDGKVSFTFPYYNHSSQFLGFVKEVPPRLSVLHVSKVLPSPEALSIISPIETLNIMSNAGCGLFAESVREVEVAEKWLRECAYVEMTVVCPVDAAWERFLPEFKGLNEEDKADLLMFHGIPVYHKGCYMREGEMEEGWRPTTLVSYKRGNGGNGDPRLDMSGVWKLIVGVGYDEGGPLGVYPIKGVLLPDHPAGVEDYGYLDVKSELIMTSIRALPTEEECDFSRFQFVAPAQAPHPSAVADAGLYADLEGGDNTFLSS